MTSKNEEKIKKRAAALRDNLKRRKEKDKAEKTPVTQNKNSNKS
ncbi:MAG: hypothetical protein OEY94_09685 [Alphaproteobacteria bacterium]|nr:hypothetical protein [Alphaproteobacteria bacterium]